MGDGLLIVWLIGWRLARWLDVRLPGGLIGGVGRLIIWVVRLCCLIGSLAD